MARSQNEKFVTVYRSTNPVEAEMMEDVLNSEGMNPRFLGTRTGALIGVPDTILQLRIEVPSVNAEAAYELVSSLLNNPAFTDQEDEFHGTDDEKVIVVPEVDSTDSKPNTPKSRFVAAGIAFLFPGLAHFYIGRTWTGFLLLIYALCGYVILLNHMQSRGVLLFVCVPFCDILFTQLNFPNPDRPKPGVFSQLGIGVVIGISLFVVMISLGT